MSYILSIAEATTTQVNTCNPTTDVRHISVNGDMANATIEESINGAKKVWNTWAENMKNSKLHQGWKFTPKADDGTYKLRFTKVTRTINGERQECVYTFRIWKLN